MKTPSQSNFASLDELGQNIKIVNRFARKTRDERGAQNDAGNGGANFFESLEEDFRAAAALHALQDFRRRVLERQVEILADVVVASDGVKKIIRNAIGIRVEKAEPAQIGDVGERIEKLRRGRP